MAATKIRVKFSDIEVLDDQDWFGAAEWAFTASVRRVATGETIPVGDPNEEHEVNTGDTIDLGWSKEIDIEAGDTQLEITLAGQDVDAVWNDDLGKVQVTLNTPIVHGYDLHLRSSEDSFVGRIQVEVVAETGGAPGSVTTIVQHFESSTYSTIYDEMLTTLVHVCPVIPVPWATGIPPIAKGVDQTKLTAQVNLSIAPGTTKLNALVNPAVIPAIAPGSTGFADRVARIKITQYSPSTLDTGKLIWKAATPNLKLWNGTTGKSEIKGGTEVKAYGVLAGAADEEGRIEVRWDSEGQPLLAVFRAWVGKPKYVWTRANIIKTTAASTTNPALTAANVKKQLDYSNVLLWQIGVLMALDTDDTVYAGTGAGVTVTKTAITGIFEVTSSNNYTFNVDDESSIVAPLLNLRSGVFNVGYLHSVQGSPGLYGMATDRRQSAAEAMVSLAGSPSTSWVRPTGVFPDTETKAIQMKRMGPSSARDASQKPIAGDGSIETINGCVMTQKGAKLPGSATLAHELGHVIGLHHRGSGGGQTVGSYDEVNHLEGPRKGRGHPWDENTMTYGPNSRRQDLDMIQAMVVRQHALLRDTLPSVPTPPTPPKPTPPTPKPPTAPQPIPTTWLPTKADIILMQEYLGGTRPGLKNTNYDLGTTGSKGDGVDGVVGSKTKQAVRDFQRDHGGLQIDGVYGPNTHDAFDQEINGSP